MSTSTLMSCFCKEHAPLKYGFDVRQSTVTGAGMGLFAVVDFDADETVQNAAALAFGKGKKEISNKGNNKKSRSLMMS